MSTIKTEHQNNVVFRVNHSSEYKLHDCLDPTKDNETTNELKIRHVEFPSTEKNPGFVGFISIVLTEMECKTIIERTGEAGFSPALVHIGGGIEVYDGTYRKSERCIIDDEKFAYCIFNRIRKFILNYYMDDIGQPWQLQSLNERMRVLKYQSGDYFQPHRDYPYKKSNTEISFVTVMLYLNSADNEKCRGPSKVVQLCFPRRNISQAKLIPLVLNTYQNVGAFYFLIMM